MIPFTPISIVSLRVNAYLFYKLSGYDRGYEDATKKPLNFSSREDLKKVLTFLRSWGCRNITHSNTEVLCKQVQNWYQTHKYEINKLPRLQKCKDKDYAIIEEVFDSLKSTYAGLRNGHKLTIAAVPASKALLLVKGSVFAPWDNKIVETLELKKTGKGYVEYLQRIAMHLDDLEIQARTRNATIEKFIFKKGRPKVSPLPKLIDEYYYLKYTRQFDADQITEMVLSSNVMSL
jgi:hypothetical protein